MVKAPEFCVNFILNPLVQSRRKPCIPNNKAYYVHRRNGIRGQGGAPREAQTNGNHYKVEIPVSSLFVFSGSPAHKKEQAVHNVRSVRRSSVCARTRRNHRVQPFSRAQREKLVRAPRRNGAPLSPDVLG